MRHFLLAIIGACLLASSPIKAAAQPAGVLIEAIRKKSCPKKQCCPGPIGFIGPIGPTGPTGAVLGITGFVSAAAYNDTDFTQQFVDPGDPIRFNTTLAQGDPNVLFYLNPTGVFGIAESGFYEITFGLRAITGDCLQSVSMEEFFPIAAISVGGTEVPGTQVAINVSSTCNATPDWTSASFILQITAPTTIQIIASNLNGNSIQVVDPDSGDTTTAFATIKKID